MPSVKLDKVLSSNQVRPHEEEVQRLGLQRLILVQNGNKAASWADHILQQSRMEFRMEILFF